MDREKTLREVYRHPLLTEKDMAVITGMHTEVMFHKGDFFLRRGERANSYLVLENGLMRSFVYDYGGNEITTNFFSNHEVVIEVLSLFQQTLSEEYIQALTDCLCWKIDLE